MIYISGVCLQLRVSTGMDALRAPIGGPPARVLPRKNSPLDCFFYLSCASLTQGISRSAERDSGLCPETLPAFRERLDLKLFISGGFRKLSCKQPQFLRVKSRMHAHIYPLRYQ